MDSSLSSLKNALAPIPDPRSKQGISHPFVGILALTLLGLIAPLTKTENPLDSGAVLSLNS